MKMVERQCQAKRVDSVNGTTTKVVRVGMKYVREPVWPSGKALGW